MTNSPSRPPAPRRSLGQNFLTDPATALTVVREAAIGPDSPVLEVGPGTGFLTRRLLDSGARVVAVEKDDQLAARLPGLFPGAPLEVVPGDFLELDLAPWLTPGLIIVGNLPYNAATAICMRCLELEPPAARLLFMFQLEVARRWCARPGSPAYGIPSLAAALGHSAKIVRKVSPGAFFPAPKIHSALVLFTPLHSPLLPPGERLPFLDYAGAAFRFRRKQAVNSLSRGTGRPAAAFQAILEKLGLAPTVRLEELSPAQLIALWREATQPSPTDGQ